jgi:hypothetical protein
VISAIEVSCKGSGKQMKTKYLIVTTLILVVVFAPSVLMIGWQVGWRGQLSYMGTTVAVPFGWLPTPKSWRNSSDPELMKAPITIFSGHARGFMRLGPNRETLKVTDEASLKVWQHSFALLYVARGYAVEGPIPAGTNSYCMVARSSMANVDTVSFCVLRNGKWKASFTGLTTDVPVFIDTVRKASETVM